MTVTKVLLSVLGACNNDRGACVQTIDGEFSAVYCTDDVAPDSCDVVNVTLTDGSSATVLTAGVVAGSTYFEEGYVTGCTATKVFEDGPDSYVCDADTDSADTDSADTDL